MCFCFDYPFQADGKGTGFHALVQLWVTDMKSFTSVNYPYFFPTYFTLSFSNTSIKDGSPIKVHSPFLKKKKKKRQS